MSANFFCTFANVSKDNANDKNKTFGLSQSNDWHPFLYCKRVQDAKKVEVKKREVEKSKLAASTKGQHLTTYTSNVLQSCQEESPLLEYIDRAKCKPLHAKNNTTKEIFMRVFTVIGYFGQQ